MKYTTNSAYDLLTGAERDILLRMWPRYEDGELVGIADELEQGMVDEISFLSVGWHIECRNGSLREPYGTRVKRPDSWKIIEEDAKKSVCDYFDSDGRCSSCPQFREDCTKSMLADIVGRCKALAERERRL